MCDLFSSVQYVKLFDQNALYYVHCVHLSIILLRYLKLQGPEQGNPHGDHHDHQRAAQHEGYTTQYLSMSQQFG